MFILTRYLLKPNPASVRAKLGRHRELLVSIRLPASQEESGYKSQTNQCTFLSRLEDHLLQYLHVVSADRYLDE